jgi:hypothetical protein
MLDAGEIDVFEVDIGGRETLIERLFRIDANLVPAGGELSGNQVE